MQEVYLVTRGSFENYHVLHVFEVQQTADDYARDYNATYPWSSANDKAVVEPVGFTPVGKKAPELEQR